MVTHSAIVKSESAQPDRAKRLDAVVVGIATAPDVILMGTAAVDPVVDVIAAAEVETVATKISFILKGKERNV